MRPARRLRPLLGQQRRRRLQRRLRRRRRRRPRASSTRHRPVPVLRRRRRLLRRVRAVRRAGHGGAAIADPDWASCYSACAASTSTTCEATAGCHADYLDRTRRSAGPAAGRSRLWDVAPSAPVAGGGCDGPRLRRRARARRLQPDYRPRQDSGSPHGSAQASRSASPSRATACCDGRPAVPGYHCEEECYRVHTDGRLRSGLLADVRARSDVRETSTAARATRARGVHRAAPATPTCVPSGGGPGDCYGTVDLRRPPPHVPGEHDARHRERLLHRATASRSPTAARTTPAVLRGTVTCAWRPPMCPDGHAARRRERLLDAASASRRECHARRLRRRSRTRRLRVAHRTASRSTRDGLHLHASGQCTCAARRSTLRTCANRARHGLRLAGLCLAVAVRHRGTTIARPSIWARARRRTTEARASSGRPTEATSPTSDAGAPTRTSTALTPTPSTGCRRSSCRRKKSPADSHAASKYTTTTSPARGDAPRGDRAHARSSSRSRC